MYPQPGSSTTTVFTRVEQTFIQSLTPNALRVYAATRSFANGHGKVTQVPQQRMAARSGVGRTQYLKGLREAQEAGAVTLVKHPYRGVTYTFTKTDTRFAAVPNGVLRKALDNLSARDLQVLLAMYLHVNSESGLTWVAAGELARCLNMHKSNLFRALRNIQQADLAVKCDRPDCPAPKPHWHLTTHQGVSQSEHPDPDPCSLYDTPGVSQSELGGCHRVNSIEDQSLKTNGTRELRSQSEGIMTRPGDDEIYPASDVWKSTENPDYGREVERKKGWPRSRGPVQPQTALARKFCDELQQIKPGMHVRQDEYQILLRWFRQRLEGGWTPETCQTAIERFTQDEGTPLSLSNHRPHIAFFAFAKWREGSFTETTTTRMREVERKRDTEVRQRLRDLEERRRQRRAENERGEA